MDVYESFMMQTVAYEDDTRAVWPSSPSAFRWKTGLYTHDERPNSNPLQVQNDTGRTLETHGPYHARVILIGIEDSHTGVSLIEPTAFLGKPPRSIPIFSSQVNITIQINELGNGAASLQLSTDRLALYMFVSTEAEG
jgi:hypothetical protein